MYEHVLKLDMLSRRRWPVILSCFHVFCDVTVVFVDDYLLFLCAKLCNEQKFMTFESAVIET